MKCKKSCGFALDEHYLVPSRYPVWRCECGETNTTVNKKYTIDFTIKRHGQFDMRARSKTEALQLFDKWIKENKRETEQFINHFTFDYDIKTNYAFYKGS